MNKHLQKKTVANILKMKYNAYKRFVKNCVLNLEFSAPGVIVYNQIKEMFVRLVLNSTIIVSIN
jgi:hypothetical protein